MKNLKADRWALSLRNFDQNLSIFTLENSFETVIWKMPNIINAWIELILC